MRQPPSSDYCESLLEALKIVPGIPTVPVISKIPVSPAPIAPNPTAQVVATVNIPPSPERLTVPTIREDNVGHQPMSGLPLPAADGPATAVEYAARLAQKRTHPSLSFGAAAARFNAPKPQQLTFTCDPYPRRKQIENQISTAAQNSSSISGSNKDNKLVAQNKGVFSSQKSNAQSSPVKRVKQKAGSPAAPTGMHDLRKRQTIDYSTGMGPTNKKQKSP